MLIGVEAKKEKLISLRSEYDALFRHFHFMQGLRFATLAATLPILGALFNYYRTALPFSQFRALQQSVVGNADPKTAIIVAVMAWCVLYAVRSIERGIGLHSLAIVHRAVVIEMQLGISSGVFSALEGRFNSPRSHRITGIISFGYVLGTIILILLINIAYCLGAMGRNKVKGGRYEFSIKS